MRSEGTVSPPSLTFSASAWNTAQTVTVTGVQDTIDDGDVTWQVRLDPASGDSDYNAVTDVDVDVTTTDDDGPPGVTLTLNPSSIAESGTGNVATVTARLSHASGAATTVTVTAVSGFYAAGTDAAIVIPAEATTAASDTATVVAVDNDTDAPDRTETVTASITNARATADSTTMAVTGAALTVRDDDAAPGAVLALNPTSISENAGLSTVTATLSRPSSEPSTVTVAAVSGSYTVGTDATITIAAGATTAASDTVFGDGGGRRHPPGERGAQRDGDGGAGERPGRRRGDRRDADPDRRRDAARGNAGAGAGVDLGGRRPLDGDGDLVGSVDRGGDGDGGGHAGCCRRPRPASRGRARR